MIPTQFNSSVGISVIDSESEGQPTTEAKIKFNDDVQIKEIRKISKSDLFLEKFELQ